VSCLNDGPDEGSGLMAGCSTEEEDPRGDKNVLWSCRFLGSGLVICPRMMGTKDLEDVNTEVSSVDFFTQ